VLGLTVGALVAGGLVLAPAASAISTGVVINEVYGGGGNSGATLKHDFIELQNVGSTPVDLSTWSVQYASAGGTSWAVTRLTGTIAPGATYLVQGAAGTGGTTDLPTPDATGNLAMSGASGKVALASTATALTCGTACVGKPDVVDILGYGTSTAGGEGTPTATLSSTTSASRTNAPDSDNNAADFTVGAPTPTNSTGETPPPPPPPVDPNAPQPPTCGTPIVAIGSVQGTTDTSPVAGSTVVVKGTVVGDVQDGLSGVFVQDSGDALTATSDGVFVYGSNLPALALGDVVAVRGTVTEFRGTNNSAPRSLTELTNAAVTVCGTAALPAPAALALPSDDDAKEAVESMLVAPTEPLTVTEVFNLTNYGELLLSQGGRLISPTEAADPGPASQSVAEQNELRSIILDDGRSTDLSPFGKPLLEPPYLEVEDPIRVGDTAVLEPVVLHYAFGAWRLQPADGSAVGSTFDATNPRPAAPAAVGGDLRIADFNVLNYFVDFPSEFGDDARGAADAAELAQQQAKIVTAITTLDADVITLHEIENSAVLTPDSPYRAVETLLAAIEQADGHDWSYVEAHEDTDVITNAIVYRTDRVTAVGAPSVPADLTAFDNARSPIAQTFRAGDETFSIIANHLKSKGSACATGNDTSAGGAGNCNGDRIAQAQALVAFAETVKRDSGDQDVLLTGDFNAYRYEDPIDVVTNAGYTDMGPVLADGQYSYVFAGGSGSLDHVFASPSVRTKLTGLAVWDINAVESFAYEYDGYEGLYAPYAYRASDHNPTVFGLTTEIPATAAIADPTPLRGDTVTVTGTGFDAGTTVTATLPSHNGTVLGTGVADANGAVSISFTVPVLLAQGSHPVDVTAADGEKAVTSFTLRPVYQDVLLRLLRFLTTGR
jgi:5'-nucleotidase